MSEGDRNYQWLKQKAQQWESLCTRCGACCGALDDPCENLRKDTKGKYFCAVYDHRFGKWHTVSGQKIVCVPISKKLKDGESWPGDEHCGYKKNPY